MYNKNYIHLLRLREKVHELSNLRKEGSKNKEQKVEENKMSVPELETSAISINIPTQNIFWGFPEVCVHMRSWCAAATLSLITTVPTAYPRISPCCCV